MASGRYIKCLKSLHPLAQLGLQHKTPATHKSAQFLGLQTQLIAHGYIQRIIETMLESLKTLLHRIKHKTKVKMGC